MRFPQSRREIGYYVPPNPELIRDAQEQVSALEKLIRTAKEAVVRTKKLLDQLT